MSQFFEMGGYAAFVWPSYAVTLAAIVLNIVWARRFGPAISYAATSASRSVVKVSEERAH